MRSVLLRSVITNNLAVVDVLSPNCSFFSFATKKMVLFPFTLYPTPCSSRPNLLTKYFTYLFICSPRLIRCIYSSYSPISSSMIDISSILRYWWSVMFSGSWWKWAVMISGPTPLYTLFSNFMSCEIFMHCFWGGPYQVCFHTWW